MLDVGCSPPREAKPRKGAWPPRGLYALLRGLPACCSVTFDPLTSDFSFQLSQFQFFNQLASALTALRFQLLAAPKVDVGGSAFLGP